MKRLPVTILVPEPADMTVCHNRQSAALLSGFGLRPHTSQYASSASSSSRRPEAGGGPELQMRHAAARGGLRIGKRGVRHLGAVIRNLLVCLLLVLPFAGSAQSLSDFYVEHAARPEFASISLEPKMMRMMSRRAKEGGATKRWPNCSMESSRSGS